VWALGCWMCGRSGSGLRSGQGRGGLHAHIPGCAPVGTSLHPCCAAGLACSLCSCAWKQHAVVLIVQTSPSTVCITKQVQTRLPLVDSWLQEPLGGP
jgi:hypothetical protein